MCHLEGHGEAPHDSGASEKTRAASPPERPVPDNMLKRQQVYSRRGATTCPEHPRASNSPQPLPRTYIPPEVSIVNVGEGVIAAGVVAVASAATAIVPTSVGVDVGVRVGVAVAVGAAAICSGSLSCSIASICF